MKKETGGTSVVQEHEEYAYLVFANGREDAIASKKKNSD